MPTSPFCGTFRAVEVKERAVGIEQEPLVALHWGLIDGLAGRVKARRRSGGGEKLHCVNQMKNDEMWLQHRRNN